MLYIRSDRSYMLLSLCSLSHRSGSPPQLEFPERK